MSQGSVNFTCFFGSRLAKFDKTPCVDKQTFSVSSNVEKLNAE